MRNEDWFEMYDFARRETSRLKLQRAKDEQDFNQARATHDSADHVIKDFEVDRTSPYEIELNHKVLELSAEQRDAYDRVVNFVHPNKQLLAIWGGEGGVDKSHVLRAVALYVQLQYGSNALVVTAVTNRAASLVKLVTIEHLFHFSTVRGTKTNKNQAWKASIASIRACFATVKLLLLDENSFLSSEVLFDMHILLTHAFPESQGLPFAGFSIVLIGDYQLPPVRPRPRSVQKPSHYQ